jgi:hypothetical protein
LLVSQAIFEPRSHAGCRFESRDQGKEKSGHALSMYPVQRASGEENPLAERAIQVTSLLHAELQEGPIENFENLCL